LQTYVEKFKRAVAKRQPLRDKTDALRLIDGAADGFPDLAVDDFAGNWLVQTRGRDFPHWLKSLGARSVYWKKLGEKESPFWICGEQLCQPFEVKENGMVFSIDFNAGYSQGLFIDQRNNRDQVRQFASGAKVLNCFAYTCGFGVAAALEGGHCVNIDMSRPYLEWGTRNYELNGLAAAEHEFLQGDVFDWLKRFAKKRRAFDVIILDPPTFSRGEKGKVFNVETSYGQLVHASIAVLKTGGKILCTTNKRSLSAAKFKALINEGLDGAWDFRRVPMPIDFPGEQYLKSWWISR
jgi:23S rRNA (cytosine1962-C5)-methyltransferase